MAQAQNTQETIWIFLKGGIILASQFLLVIFAKLCMTFPGLAASQQPCVYLRVRFISRPPMSFPNHGERGTIKT